MKIKDNVCSAISMRRMLCTRPRYKLVSVYRTIGPLVLCFIGSTETTYNSFEPEHEKFNSLHMRKQRRRSASR